VDPLGKSKKPAELCAPAGLNLKSAIYEFAVSGKHLRRRVLRVMMAVMDVRLHCKEVNGTNQPASRELSPKPCRFFDGNHRISASTPA
jgi:hypothetical protein